MASRLISSLARCSIPRVSFISGSQFFSPTPWHALTLNSLARCSIPRTLILRNLFSNSTSLEGEDDKIKRADENLLLVLESVIVKKNSLKKVWPKDFQFEIIDNPEDGSITLKREYNNEQIEAKASRDYISSISLVVTIDKKVGPTLYICCNLTADDFEIESATLESSDHFDVYCFGTPNLRGLDKSLQKAFEEYLAARGFTKSFYDDCLRYWIDGQRYFPWQGLKKVVEK